MDKQKSYNKNNKRKNRDKNSSKDESSDHIVNVVHINRCAKVVKGGRRFSFSALVVIGDGKGRVGYGQGKAKEMPEAIRKATESAKKDCEKSTEIPLNGTTIPHLVYGKFDGGRVLLKPAAPGTGVIAGGGVRAVLEPLGVSDILSKSQGSNNPLAVVKATVKAVRQLRSAAEIARMKSA